MRHDVDWTSYAAVYDLMATHNPAYQEIVEVARSEIKHWRLPAGSVIADFGAGTGNFSIPIATMLPEAKVIHIDSDSGMLASARRKGAESGLKNLEFLQRDAATLSMEPKSLDCAVSIHALYTFENPLAFLCDLNRWMKPGAPVLLCNFGRQMRVGDWALYLFKNLRATRGTLGAAEVFVRGRHVAKQNSRIAMKQKSGEYWLHSPEEFRRSVEAAGFHVRSQRKCYRDYSDLIVCHRPGD